MGSQVLRLPESAGHIVNVQFWKTLRRSAEAVAVFVEKESSQTSAFRAVRKVISAAEYSVGSIEGSPVPSRPGGWEPGTSTHVSSEHDVGASGAPENGGIVRPLHYALLSSGKLSDQVVGRNGG